MVRSLKNNPHFLYSGIPQTPLEKSRDFRIPLTRVCYIDSIMIRPPSRHIRDTSSVFRETLQAWRNQEGPRTHLQTIFGADALKRIRELRRVHAYAAAEEEREAVFLELDQLRRSKATIYRFVDFFIETTSPNAPFREKVEALIATDATMQTEVVKLGKVFIARKVDGNLLEEMLTYHVENLERMRTEVPRWRERFIVSLYEAIRSKQLPLEMDVAEHRLARTRVRVIDPVLFRGPDNLAETGIYDPGEEEMHLFASPTSDMEHAYAHEAVHLLSGMTILRRGKGKGIRIQRLGLNFRIGEGAQVSRLGCLEWLNEAITEEISQALVPGTYGDGSYVSERRLLQNLYRMGLSRDILYAAYFENKDVDAEIGKQLPAWRVLVDHCNEIFKSQGGIRYLYAMQPS